ncbi:MAG: DNA polymerase III subunit delta [Chloroflexi bacterium]|nr:DNA polymerase III subunit delta [Chloroflexota bacterium]
MPENSTPEKEDVRVYVFIGDDLDAMANAESELVEELGNAEMAAFNIAHLNGNTNNLDELVKNISLLPFGSLRRLVIDVDPLARISADKEVERWKHIVENLPPSAELVLEIITSWVKKQKDWMWKSYVDHIWLKKWIKDNETWLTLREFRIPSKQEMPMRIKTMVEEESGSIEEQAASELAQVVGDDIIMLRQEVRKLCLYTNGERSIKVEDVRMLCSSIPEEDVFSMVDAFAQGNAKQALHHLKLMFANQEYVYVFAMVVRQFRLLLMVKEALQETKNEAEIAKMLHEHPYVIKKIAQQSQRFNFNQLEDIYRSLYELDGNVKRGLVQPDVGLEMLFFEKSSRASH